MVQGRIERPALFADVGQSCSVVRRDPDCVAHERGTEVEKAEADSLELAQFDREAPLHYRPVTPRQTGRVDSAPNRRSGCGDTRETPANR